MSSGLTRALLLAAFLISIAGVAGSAGEPQSPGTDAASALAEQEQADCTKNLKTIYESIQAYQLEHRDIPNWLSDLVPQYLPDANVLVCPVCRRTGKTEYPPLADPKLPSSYLFEFCPVPLGSMATNAPNHTRRDWKRRQMGMLGSVVPIVRCRHHNPALNLAFDGHVYESPGQWELAFTNRVTLASLQPAALFADVTPPAPRPPRVPARNPKATPQQLDLSKNYNAGLFENWLGKTNENLSAFPRGLATVLGTPFDARGIVQLAGKSLTEKRFPREVRGVPVKLKCKQLHFLHAAVGGTPADAGTQIGSYFVSFLGNPARLEIPILFGRDVRDWHPAPDEPAPTPDLKVAWSSDQVSAAEAKKGAPQNHSKPARLFKTTWVNLLPDLLVDRIDFVSAMNGPAPFLIAITAE
jgi:hypothetical protein